MMARTGIPIGRLAERSGCKVQTIRYYETIGLLPEPPRTEGNQRLYQPEHVDTLIFIRRSRELGFSLDAIRELIRLGTECGQSCEGADRIARARLAEVETKLEQLTRLKAELLRIISACANDTVETCAILRSLHREDGGNGGI